MQVRNLLFYEFADKKANISVYFDKGSFWLTQKAMAALFGVKIPAISKHLKNIFDSQELEETSVISILETTAKDCFYNATEGKLTGKFLELSDYAILRDKGKVSI